MDLIADVLLLSGAVGAGFYCMVLSRRLTRFTDLEQGVGGAVAILSVQVDELKAALEAARDTSTAAADRLEDTTQRAEQMAHRMELLMASSRADHSDPLPNGVLGPRNIRRRRRPPSQSEPQEDAA